jgi:hypothetical protein
MVLLKSHACYLKGERKINVIRVQPRTHVPDRPIQALVYRVGLSFIWPADPIRQPPLVSPNNVDTLVGAPTINDYVLDIRISLQEHGPDCLLEE